MRHYKKGRKLGTDASHTKAMKKSLVSSLFLNDRIKTVDARAKEIRGDVDRVIGWAKRGDVHARRLAIAALGDKELVREIFEKVEQGMFADRNGGYTRILKLGNRKGDNASMVIMELVTETVSAKKKSKSDTKKAAPKKAAQKKTDAAKADEVKLEEEAVLDLEKVEEEVKEEAEEAVEKADAAGKVEDAVEAAETAAKAEEAEEKAQEAGEAIEAAVEEEIKEKSQDDK